MEGNDRVSDHFLVCSYGLASLPVIVLDLLLSALPNRTEGHVRASLAVALEKTSLHRPHSMQE